MQPALSVAKSAETRKRSLPLEQAEDLDKTSYQLNEPPSLTKRPREDAPPAALVPITITSQKSVPAQFLLFHLKMLKSLYESTEDFEQTGDMDNEDNDDNDEEEEEEEEQQHLAPSRPSVIDDTIWQMMEDFLKQRNKILLTQKEAQQSQDVHAAARDFLGNNSGTVNSSSSSSTLLYPGQSHHHPGSGETNSPDPIFRRRTQEQALSLHHHNSPATILQSPLNKSLHTSYASMAHASQTIGQRQPFRFVALLLQRRADSIRAQYREAALPYVQLFTWVQEQMDRLTQQVRHLEQWLGQSSRRLRLRLLESPQSPPPTLTNRRRHEQQTEERQSALAATRAKLELWKKLHHDLQTTIRLCREEDPLAG